MKILSIGNSFSRDAHRYLHPISIIEGSPIKTVNLYLEGCSLQEHHKNMLEDERKYCLDINGESTTFYSSIKEALTSDKWDFVTLQQASTYSAHIDSYQPYLSELSSVIRNLVPTAKILMHETWAYASYAKERLNAARCNSAEDMFNGIRFAYDKAAHDIGAHGVIPSAEAIAIAINNGISSVYRDGFHLSFGAGRYLIGLLWYRFLTNCASSYTPCLTTDEPITNEDLDIIKKTIKRALQ